MPLPQLAQLELGALLYASIFIGFGVLAFLNPAKALSFFELPWPEDTPKASSKSQANTTTAALAQAKQTIHVFAVVYGIRDIFMGAAIFAAALCGTPATLGWIVLAGAGVAFTDGAACYWMVGKGQMNHWGYAPLMLATAGKLLGVVEWAPMEALMEGLRGML
ncbi:hypothetical protein BDY17DRAFT_288744 [Neohortaea acidophila]|uniref:Uncharacterized protein n=1 Tax=Neohortaea acidophila TaxID=245834 RepID=A0A6A6Q4U0_9PEZI|nr:uncharacterized protein BDY17DRAFT_288744 [Neohortaea acidophila]KAF2487325.1 hypothetical protein BDY17DRAFT_288744 [Neohortaea acidophila]